MSNEIIAEFERTHSLIRNLGMWAETVEQYHPKWTGLIAYLKEAERACPGLIYWQTLIRIALSSHGQEDGRAAWLADLGEAAENCAAHYREEKK